ncbi:Bet v I domain [Macleaya cordata]|uniref:Bet v I domain n=1 Tax=Macleaya cordata TaxID=56857 RepID=A0A200QAF5_MACCD|nr:Bet v I domain [Macleaya cordata]OVA14963.1 Bet v I domain [Macleaya cordata]
MGVISFDDEFSSAVAPHRLFHALFEDAHNLMPKIMPHGVKSVDFVSGEGGPGSVQQVNFPDGGPVKYVKNRLDSKDKDNLEIKYTVIECDAFGDKIDFISNEIKFEAGPDGGCICKSKSTYHPKGDAVLNEEEIKAGKERSKGMFKFVEAYLIENPQLYA